MTTRGPALGRAPARLLVPAGVAAVFLALPLVALLARTPWADFLGQLTEPAILDALRLSLVTSLAALAVVTVIGVPLAWVLARVEFPGRSLVRAMSEMPFRIPGAGSVHAETAPARNFRTQSAR